MTKREYKSFFKKEQEILFEMSNLIKSDTGLNYKIWIQVKTGKEKHWARIKVEVNSELIPISISDNPEIMIKAKQDIIDSKNLNQIKKWIIINKDLLLEYWNSKGDLGLKEFFKRMKKIK